MANGRLGTWNLSAGINQAIYVCNNDQATVLTLNIVNRNTVPANIRVAISTSATDPGLAEYIEYDVEILPKGVYERNGLVIGPGNYLVVKSNESLVNAVCWGVEVGATITSNNFSANTGTTPTWVTAAGSLGVVLVGNPLLSESTTLRATDPYNDILKFSVTSGSLPAGMSLQSDGVLVNGGTSTGYTPGASGQTTSFDVRASNGTNGVVRSFSITKRWNDGSTQALAAPSGYWLAQNIGSAYLNSGTYWIKTARMPSALQMYVNMTLEGGGYDFYRVTSGPAASYITDAHAGTPLGLDLWMPRSKFNWQAARQYATSVIGSSDYSYFANVIGIYRNTSVGQGSTNYVSVPMRSVEYANRVDGRPIAGTYAPDWRVLDGGRWWLRDTNYSEPNGDYNANGFLGNMDRGSFPGGTYALADLVFNDGGAYSTGNTYFLSTNAKP
jgi:hypothetical protein